MVLMKTMDNVATFCMLPMLFIFIFRWSPAYPGAHTQGLLGPWAGAWGVWTELLPRSTPDLVNPDTVTSSLGEPAPLSLHSLLGKSCPSEPQCSHLCWDQLWCFSS